MRKHWIGIIKWNDGTILKTEPFYDYDEGIKAWSSKFSYENKGKFEWIDYEKIEPKQETLEEAAERWNDNQTTLEFGKPHNAPSRIKAFIEGAKWEQEQNEILLNEYHEYTVDCIEVDLKRPLPFKSWFKQNKKK